MAPVPYVLVGGGMTAAAAAEAIRAADPTGGITLISSDAHPPYARPPLSKALWKGEPEESIWRGTDRLAVDLRLGRTVVALDPAGKTVTLTGGEKIPYGKLLLATGGTPRRLALPTPQIIYFRTYDDYRRLRALANEKLRFLVLGGGFVGSEIAAALKLVGRDVTMLIPEQGIGARVFPADLAANLVEHYREKGVTVRTGEGLASLDHDAGAVHVKTTRGDSLTADVIVAGLGILPNVELAEQAGLRVENGIVVDQMLRTSDSNIYAAGDVASFFNPALDARVRVEHEDNANTMGAAAGRAMAGQGEPYTHLPFFYSDMFDLGYEAVGELDSRLEAVSDWKERFREGVVRYVHDGHVRGVLLWNTWGQLDAARAEIGKPLRA